MGTLQLALTVLAMSAPIGNVTGVLPLGITRGNGIGTPVIYAFVGVIFLLFAVGFTTMTRNLPKPGAFYTYITAGLSRTLGLGTGLLAAFTYLVFMIGSYAFFGVSIENVLSSFGAPSTPWWLWAALCCVIITALGHFNVELSGKVLSAFMVAEVVLVMLFNAPVLFTGGPQGYQVESFQPAHVFQGTSASQLSSQSRAFSASSPPRSTATRSNGPKRRSRVRPISRSPASERSTSSLHGRS